MRRSLWLLGLTLACGQLGFESLDAGSGVADVNVDGNDPADSGIDVMVDAALPDVTLPDAGCIHGTTRVVGPCGALGANTETCQDGRWGDAMCIEMPVATHQGWVDVTSAGVLGSAATPLPLPTRAAVLVIRWNPPVVTPAVAVVEGYRILRATSQAGPFVMVAELAAADPPRFQDTSIRTEAAYYYVVRPVVGGVELPTNQADSVLEVPLPPENMALVHRWVANQETCARLGQPVDRERDYRCAYTGPGRVAYTGDIGMPPADESFFDIGNHRFVDMVEVGCAYTQSSAGCPAATGAPGPCLGIGAQAPDDPANDKAGQSQVGVEGDVFYDRGSSQCWYRNAAGWVSTGGASEAELDQMSSNAAGLPPLVRITQIQSDTVCQARGEGSFLLSRRTQVAASAWPTTATEMSIGELEAGAIPGSCNSDGGHPGEVMFDDLVFPNDAESLPTTVSSGVRTVRTGGMATLRCFSRYGIQDLIGNVWEWTSDQCMSTAGTCTGVASTLAPTTNPHFNDIPLAEALGGGGDSFTFDDVPRWLPVLGLPAPSDAPAWQMSQAVDPEVLHDDGIFIFADSSTLKGMYVGGSSTAGTGAGRYALNVSEAPTHTHPRIGFRCMQVVP